MKKLIMSALLVFVVGFTFAQNQEETTSASKFGKFGENFKLGVGLFTDIWMNTPDGFEDQWYNRGVDVTGMYNHQLGQSNFHLGIGASLGMHNLYLNNSSLEIDESTGAYMFEEFEGERNYNTSKVNMTYVDVPVELRYKTDFGLHINPGFKVGYLINNSTKYKGTQVLDGYPDVTAINKQKNLPFFSEFRYGPTMRIGYKWINLTAYYQVSELFEKGYGPSSMAPLSLGISIMPF